MTLHQLYCFKTVAECGNFADAAEALMVAASDLGSAVSELEKELGVRLFERRSINSPMTEEGRAFLEYVKTALDSLENGKNAMRAFADEAKRGIAVGYIYSVSRDIQNMLSGFIIDFEDDSNIDMKYNVQYSNAAALETLETGQAELVFCTDPPDTVESKKLFDQNLFFAVSQEHPMAKSRLPVTREMLENEPIVMIDDKTMIRRAVDRFFEEQGITPKIACTEDGCRSAAAHVAAGYGYTIIPDLPELGQSGVRLLDPGEFSIKRAIYMVWKKDGKLSHYAGLLKKYIFEMYS